LLSEVVVAVIRIENSIKIKTGIEEASSLIKKMPSGEFSSVFKGADTH